MMTIPWRWKPASGSVAVIGGTADGLAWLHAQAGPSCSLRAGGLLVRRAGEDVAGLARRLRGLGLPPRATGALLPVDASQLLQIEAPKVAAEELRAAARWQVKDFVKGPLDELTIDVMPVGDGREQCERHLFVAAAPSALIRERVELAAAAGLEIAVVDIVEAAQRNLQLALAEAEGLGSKSGAATAALTRQGGQALLTICAAGELFYARRVEGVDARPEPAATVEPLELALDEALESAAIVDYGAEDAGETGGSEIEAEAPLVIELQRSLDVWERTWREMPVARLWVELGEDSASWIPRLQATLGLPVSRLDAERVWRGFDRLAPTAAEREALLPLAGALLRHAPRTS